MKIIMTILGLLYVICPYDLDFIVGWGWIDDLVILALLWKYYYSGKARKQSGFSERQKYSGTNENTDFYQNRTRDTFSGTQETNAEQDPYIILGVDKNASIEDIKKAYKALAMKYHPDKVSYLGDDFRTLAEGKFKEIQQAYQKLCPK